MVSSTFVPLTTPSDPEAAVQRETGDAHPVSVVPVEVLPSDMELTPERLPMLMPVQNLTPWTPLRAVGAAVEFFVKSPLAAEKDERA